jgi:hypothetical protein
MRNGSVPRQRNQGTTDMIALSWSITLPNEGTYATTKRCSSFVLFVSFVVNEPCCFGEEIKLVSVR